MSGKSRDLDQILDQAISEIHDSGMDSQAEQAAADRVWERVSAEISKISDGSEERRQIRDCSSY